VVLGVRYEQLPWRDNTPEQRERYPVGTARALSATLGVGARPSVPVNLLLLAGLAVVSVWAAGFE
jgi:hypothetical protein